MAWPVDMSLTSGGTSSEPKEKSLPEFDASDALEIVFSSAAACLSSTSVWRPTGAASAAARRGGAFLEATGGDARCSGGRVVVGARDRAARCESWEQKTEDEIYSARRRTAGVDLIIEGAVVGDVEVVQRPGGTI